MCCVLCYIEVRLSVLYINLYKVLVSFRCIYSSHLDFQDQPSLLLCPQTCMVWCSKINFDLKNQIISIIVYVYIIENKFVSLAGGGGGCGGLHEVRFSALDAAPRGLCAFTSPALRRLPSRNIGHAGGCPRSVMLLYHNLLYHNL